MNKQMQCWQRGRKEMCSYIEIMVLVLLSCITLIVVMGAIGLVCYVVSNWKDLCNEGSGRL
jgi:hypothetical protein